MVIDEPDFVEIARRAGIPITAEEIIDELKKELEEQGSIINNDSTFSPFWRLIEEGMAKPYEHELNTLLTVVMPQSFVRTSDGEALDTRLWEVGLTRGEDGYAVGRITIEREPNSPAITIPANYGISTERINGEVFRVQTLFPQVLPPNESESFLEVVAENTGAIYNMGAGFYRIPDFDLPGVTQMYNGENWIITPGTDQEQAESARLRYRDRFSSGNWHIDSNYKSIITEYGGVESDTIYFNHDAPRGPGTANFYLLLDKGIDADEVLKPINDAIGAGYHGNGDDMVGLPMEELQTDLTCDVWFLSTMTADDKADLLTNIENFIRCAFRENRLFSEDDVTKIKPASRFSMSRLGQELHRQFFNIDNLEFDVNHLITELNVYRLESLVVQEAT